MSTNFNEFDILFHNFFYPTSGFGSAATTKQPHPLNIFYDNNGLHFEVACTGLSKEDVELNIEGDILKISYQRFEKKEYEDRTYIHQGVAKRSFNLGYKIASKFDLSQAEAMMENGLLAIRIPYAEEAKPKTLKIK